MNRYTRAAENAKLAAEDLSAKFRSAYWSLLIGLTLAAVLAGVLMGVLFVREFDPPQENIIERVIVPVESIPAVKPGKR